MSQTRRQSLLEAALSNSTSFVISLFGNMLILPWFQLHPSWIQSIGIGGTFQAIFMIKTYLIRRFFNAL